MRVWPALAVCALFAGCGGGERTTASSPIAAEPRATTHSSRPAPHDPAPAHCPDAAGNCRSAQGRIIYIEAVDPDGDGDAHFVLASRQSVTAPGISVIDVERELRPRPLPRLGTRVSAAGPVYHGSYGQLQIQATVLHVAGG